MLCRVLCDQFQGSLGLMTDNVPLNVLLIDVNGMEVGWGWVG